MFFRHVIVSFILASALLVGPGASALMPFPRPEPINTVANGSATPFVGEWAVIRPTMVMGERDTNLAICALPVRIQAIGDNQITYLRPRQNQSDTIMTLRETNGGTLWSQTGESKSYFAFWVSPDGFYLYDRVPQEDAEWGRPYLYQRCP